MDALLCSPPRHPAFPEKEWVKSFEPTLLVLVLHVGHYQRNLQEMVLMNERVKDLIYSVILIAIVALIVWNPASAGEVYMQLISPQEATSNVRGLRRGARMTEKECLKQKEKVEAPLSIGYRSVPSGWRVECIPVNYLDD